MEIYYLMEVLMAVQVTEKQVKEKVKKIINIFEKYNAIYTLTPMTMGYGESGHPDRLLLIAGNMVGIEVKKDKNNHHSRPELKPKPNEVMQKRQAKKIIDAGGTWVCIHNDNLKDLVDLLAQNTENGMEGFTQADKEQIIKLIG